MPLSRTASIISIRTGPDARASGPLGRVRLSLVQEGVMTVSEYEERFRPPAPSVHQAFIDMHGPKWKRRRRLRLWIAAALLGLMTATMTTASHRTADIDPGQGPLPLQTQIRWASHRGIDC
jgi:hypothetical protein